MRWWCLSVLTALPWPVAAEPLEVFADSYPVAYFAERIAGDAGVEVVLPVPADHDPSLWSPSIEQIAAFQEADLILLNGAGLAGWTATVTLPNARVVDTSADFGDRLIETESVTHSHGEEGEHSHTGVASFIWLDPELAAIQAQAIREALEALLPDQLAVLRSNYAGLADDLSTLDARAKEVAALADGARLLASHPRYQYFARRYGLDIVGVSLEPTEAPDPDQLAELDRRLAERPAGLMLWEAEPTMEAREAMRARALTEVVFPTLANRPANGDFVEEMNASLSRLRSALQAP
jgi:zinc transport system substrate-binding protein